MRRRPVCGSKKHSVNKSLIHDIAVSPDKKKKKKRKEKRKRKKKKKKIEERSHLSFCDVSKKRSFEGELSSSCNLFIKTNKFSCNLASVFAPCLLA